MKLRIKKDKFQKARGGKSKLLDISCIKCDTLLLKYQKDGKGSLQRCYLNRIFYPPDLEKLQHDSKIRTTKELSNLTCKSCNTVIGAPMLHHDGRLALRLRKGLYSKKIS